MAVAFYEEGAGGAAWGAEEAELMGASLALGATAVVVAALLRLKKAPAVQEPLL